MTRISLLAALLVAALAAPSAAQSSCSHLSVSGQGHHGTMMKFSLTGGSGHAPAIMVFGMQEGQTTFNFGMMGALHLGLGGPLYPMSMGMTNTVGQCDLSLQVPHGMMHRIQMFGQGFTMVYHPGYHHHHQHHPAHFEFCTSNVCGFHAGGRSGM